MYSKGGQGRSFVLGILCRCSVAWGLALRATQHPATGLAMVRHMQRLSDQPPSEEERCGVQPDTYFDGRGALWVVHRTRKHDSGLVWYRVPSRSWIGIPMRSGNHL